MRTVATGDRTVPLLDRTIDLKYNLLFKRYDYNYYVPRYIVAVRVRRCDYILLFLKNLAIIQNEQNVSLNCEMSFSAISSFKII